MPLAPLGSPVRHVGHDRSAAAKMDRMAEMDDGLHAGLAGASERLTAVLQTYVPADDVEEADVRRIVRLVASVVDPWSRTERLHLTASAIVLHAPSRRVLLRWHERFNRFMQVGGHGDPGEWDPCAIALREAAEETGLSDLRPFPRREEGIAGDLVHVAVVPVPARAGEPAHEHADMRFLFDTQRPDEARPETPASPVRWVSLEEALELVDEQNLRVLLERTRAALS
jgi:8-oxo-dGTP pyrophosphatase MutT (NUDIX family)